MIFNHEKLDNFLKHYNVIQLSFITKHASEIYSKALLKNNYIDITHYFINHEASALPIEEIQEIINENPTVFDINAFYNHWVGLHGRSYNNITWSYYFILKNLLQPGKSRLVVIAYNRKLIDCQRLKLEQIDNVLFCDFLDLYINSLYHEYKLYIDDLKTFNQYLNELAEAGVTIEKHNLIMIQYMKLTGNAIERIYM